MLKSLHRWIGRNILGFIAIFIAAGGGTAFALAGTNTVRSDDIVNGEVRLPDLHDGLLGAGVTRVQDVELSGGKAAVAVAETNLGPDRGGAMMQANGSVELRDTADGSDANVAVSIRLAGGGNTLTGPEFAATIPDGGQVSIPAGAQCDALPAGAYRLELDIRSDSPATVGSRVLNAAVLPN
jgi:hypothetical protein